MISLMAYALAVSGLLGLAAVFAERALTGLDRARCGVWLIALAGSLLLPARVLFGSAAPGPAGESVAFPFELLPAVMPVEFARVVTGALRESWLTLPDWSAFDPALTAFWLLSSAAALLVYAAAGLFIRRATRRAETQAVGGYEVVISDRLGPAVVGFFKPVIVLPRWIAHADSQMRSLVLRHEREHVAARDPLLLLGALLLVAAMAWNPVLWWQLGRLRAAIEIDCDARVLRGGADTLDYSNALLFVRQRRARTPIGTVALTEPVSQLERRIRIMLTTTRKFSVSRTGLQTVSALAVVALALFIETPLAQQSADSQAASGGPKAIPAIRIPVFDRLNEAQACMDNGDFGCARAWLDSVEQMSDLSNYESAQLWNFRAFVYFDMGDTEGAIGAYERIVDLPFEDLPDGFIARALRNLGTLYANTGRYERAFEVLDELLAFQGTPAPSDGLGEPGQAPSDGEYLPIVTIAPVYPARALARGLEGYVLVSFTVTENGSTSDIEVVDASSSLFEQSAIDSVEKYKYKPRVTDGRPVAVPGVTTRIEFVLEGKDGEREAEA